MKKFTQFWDRLPLWLRTAAYEQEYENVRNEEMTTIPDPEAPGETLRVAVVYLYINEKKTDSEKQADHVVGAYWKDMGGESDLFSKSFSDADAAREAYDNIKKELADIQAVVKTDTKLAKNLAKSFFDKHKLASGPHTDVSTPGSGSKVMTVLHQFANGWQIVSSIDEKPHVYFGYGFLEDALRKFEPVTDLPSQKPDLVYQTSSKTHCGSHNYVVSYWKKTLTKEGNIIRNTAEIFREDKNEVVRIVRKKVSLSDFDVICSSLTPLQTDYGLFYDKNAGKWIKTAKAIQQTIFFDSIEELLRYQKEQKNLGEQTKGKTEKLPEPQEGKSSPKEKEIPSSISFEELAKDKEKLPETITPSEVGSPMESLEKKPSTAPSFAKSSLNVEAKFNVEDIKKGDLVIYRTDDGKVIRGIVDKKYEESGKIKFDLAAPVSGKITKGCEEEISSDGELISFFMRPEEYSAERAREIKYNVEKSKDVLKPHEVVTPSEVMEEREKIVPEEGLEEVVEPEEGAPLEEVELETSFRPLSSIEITSALSQWIDWPEGLPNTWMKEVYSKLGTTFKLGPSEDLKFPGLKIEVQELAAKKKRSDEAYQKFAEGESEIARKTKQISLEMLSLNEDIARAEVSKNSRAVTDLSEKKEGLQEKLTNIEEEFQRSKQEYRRAYVDPESYKDALVRLFYKYAPLSSAKVQLSVKEDPAKALEVSKDIRKLINEEKEIANKIQKTISDLLEGVSNKEDELWELFKGLPGYEYEAAIQQRINHIDSYFSDYLTRNINPSPEAVTKFQDTIQNLEKERQEAFKKSKLLPEHQSKVDALIKEIEDLRNSVLKGPHHKEIIDLEKEREKIEKEKNKLQDEIGVIASAKLILEILGEKK